MFDKHIKEKKKTTKYNFINTKETQKETHKNNEKKNNRFRCNDFIQKNQKKRELINY